jgi:putative transposase
MDVCYQEVYAMNKTEARKRLVKTYETTGNLSQTARLWGTSRQVVRQWVRRYQQEGLSGLEDRSRRPRASPQKTPPEVEEVVLEARRKTGYGRKRLAWYLAWQKGLYLSPHTIRHILRRNGFGGKRRRRKTFYPIHWAWEQEVSFSLAQVDVKDVLDKGTLGTKLWDHMRKHRLPRYQWTFCEGRSRLRFLAYSREQSLSNGLCFMALVMLWLRMYGIMGEVAWQTDWGEEFGGSSPAKLARLQERCYGPLGARLARIPLGKKGYNGRVERSHRSDDEEFYIPFLANIGDEQQLLQKAAGWLYFYNLVRPHYGDGMEGKPPLEKLLQLGYDLPEQFALFPPLLLDAVSVEWAAQGGNDLLAHYINLRVFNNKGFGGGYLLGGADLHFSALV